MCCSLGAGGAFFVLGDCAALAPQNPTATINTVINLAKKCISKHLTTKTHARKIKTNVK
jgi:hypothetical protein